MTKKRDYKHEVVMLLLLIAIAALGAVVLSSALFGQQHSWYNISQPGNDVNCSKCHQIISDEYTTAGNRHYSDDMSCEDCHRNETGVTYAIGDGQGFQPGEEAHAASIPPCRQCHILDITDIHSVNESHKPLVDTSGLNEACVMCHTGFDKSMNFTRARYLRYNITKVGEKWTVEGFEFKESKSTIIPQILPGDKHTWEKASKNCFECHSDDVKSALADGGHVPKSKNTSGSCDTEYSDVGHLGRRHDFNRGGSVSIDSCRPCHLPNATNFGTPHSEAQLDYHAATTEHCYNCHFYGTATAPGGSSCSSCEKCHDMLRTDGNHTEILDSMGTQNFCWYQIDKVCVGCHMPGPGHNVPFDNRQFDVYTEPSTLIEMTPQP